MSVSFIRLRHRRTHQADNLATIYIISFPGDVSTTLNMIIGCGCSHPCHSERKRGNPADRRTHQADNLAKLRLEFLSVPKTDSKDFLRGRNCENKCGQWQSPLGFRSYLGDSHVALLLGMTFGAVATT